MEITVYYHVLLLVWDNKPYQKNLKKVLASHTPGNWVTHFINRNGGIDIEGDVEGVFSGKVFLFTHGDYGKIKVGKLYSPRVSKPIRDEDWLENTETIINHLTFIEATKVHMFACGQYRQLDWWRDKVPNCIIIPDTSCGSGFPAMGMMAEGAAKNASNTFKV